VSKVIAVCDAYDALRSPKSYRAAWTHEQSLAHIEGEAGSSFDHAVANSFVAMMRRLEGRMTHGDHPGELPPLLPEVSSFDYRPSGVPRLLGNGAQGNGS